RIDVRHVGTLLLVNRNETTVADLHTGLLGTDLLAIGRTAHGLQNQVVTLRLGRSILAFESHPDAIFARFGGHSAGFQHHVIKAVLVHLLPHLDHVAVCSWHQASLHFHHVQACTQSRVHRTHFQTDDATTHDQHALGHRLQFQRAGGVHHAWIVRQEWQFYRLATGRNNGRAELDHFLGAVVGGHFDVVGVQELAVTNHNLHLAALGHTSQATGQLADHLVLVIAQRVDIDL